MTGIAQVVQAQVAQVGDARKLLLFVAKAKTVAMLHVTLVAIS
jgi:hypothetical protein